MCLDLPIGFRFLARLQIQIVSGPTYATNRQVYRNLWYKGRSRNRNCQCAKIYATAIKLTQTSFSTVVMKLSSTFISGHCLQSLAKRSFFILLLLLSNTTYNIYNPWLLWFSSTGSFTHWTVNLVLKGEELCPLGPWSPFLRSSAAWSPFPVISCHILKCQRLRWRRNTIPQKHKRATKAVRDLKCRKRRGVAGGVVWLLVWGGVVAGVGWGGCWGWCGVVAVHIPYIGAFGPENL